MKIFLWTREDEWAGKSFLDLAAPESREELAAILGASAASGPPERHEVVGLKADGSRFEMEVTPGRMTFQGKAATQAILRDITDRRRAEQALRESEERYRLLFENNPQPMWVFDNETLGFLAVNDAACRHYGYSRKEFLAMTIGDIRPAEEIPALLQSMASQSDEFHKAGVWRHRKKDGTAIAVEIASHPMLFAGRPAQLILATDVTERMRAEEALRQSEQRYRDIFDFATVGIYQSRRDGSLITVNAPLAEILDYDSPEDLLRHNLDEIYADPAERQELIARFEPTGKSHRQEVLWKRKDGTPIWLELDARTVRNADGTTRYFEGFVHDISERKKSEEEKRRLQEQLVQAQKMEAVGQLAGGIAHDFNNLLTAITGYSELLLGELPPEDLRRSHAEEIRKAGERAASLTQQLLAFSRRQVLEPKVLDVNTVVSDIERMLRRLIGEHIELKTRKTQDLWKVKADPGQIEQAILNLVLNARDAMPSGGTLAIETSNAELDESLRPQPRPDAAGLLRDGRRQRHGHRHQRRGQGAPLRALLHDQGAGEGNGPRALDDLRDRQAERRLSLVRQRGRPRHDVPGLPSARGRARLGGSGAQELPADPPGGRDRPAGRGRAGGALARAADPEDPGVHGRHGGQPRRGRWRSPGSSRGRSSSWSPTS